MHSPAPQNEHGFALVLELVVVAMVLSALGLGMYQYLHHSKEAASVTAPVSAVSAASDINDVLVKSANVEVQDSTNADAMGDELQAADAASADVEGGIDENSF